MKTINILGGQNAEQLNIKVVGTYSYHCALERYRTNSKKKDYS
jgi:hypothetical protein